MKAAVGMIEFVLLNANQQGERFRFSEGPIELGRENARSLPRIVVNDPFTSRHHVLVDDAAEGQLRVVNLTDKAGRPVQISNGVVLQNGEQALATPPFRLQFGTSTVEVRRVETDSAYLQSFHSIERQSLIAPAPRLDNTVAKVQANPTPERLLAEWFDALLGVQRAVAGSTEFYEEAAKAVVHIVGLDRGMVILRSGGVWERRAFYAKEADDRLGYSSRVLDEVVSQRQTIFQSFSEGEVVKSLVGLQAVVASPIWDEQEQVIGAMFGSRDLRFDKATAGIRPLEAQFVQVIANMVSVGLIRTAHEAEANRMRAQFEGFFSKPLAMALERDRTLLDARQRELTMLFLDLRGFSRIAERVGPGQTYQFLSECLNRFTEIVMQFDGVVIDYYGDGFAAMWNAPLEEPRHAELAARAALKIQTIVPELNEKYQGVLGAAVRIGIGLHTGEAQVGNSGSTFRLKFGPRGHAVNLTSRVEGANKLIGTSCLLTSVTRQKLPAEMQVRRVCRARLSGLQEPIDLFELGALAPSETWLRLRADYEQALELYEQQRPLECLQCCAKILASSVTDDVTRWLLNLANGRIGNPDYDPVVQFENK
jgi:adenylate cyclase